MVGPSSLCPGYSVPEGLMSLYQPDGGMLCPEKIIQVPGMWRGPRGRHTVLGVWRGHWEGTQP